MDYGPEQLWPPIPAVVSGPVEEWAAWYSGDPARLANVYGAAAVTSPSGIVTPGVYGRGEGGIIGAAKRLFWGSPTGPDRSRGKLHMPLAQDIATASADLLFGEAIAVEWDSPGAEDRMAYVFEGNDAPSQLSEAAELAAALGGVYLRAGWDAEVADHALMSVVHADKVVPRFRYGRLWEAIVWELLEEDGGRIWRHLEHHEPGVIRHTLHIGSADRLGPAVSLDQRPETAGLPEAVPTGLPGLALVYVPNVRPVPQWRHDPLGRNLGRSDFGARGVTGFMDAVDETWTSWLRDLRLGKARLLVSQTMLDNTGPGRGAMIDLDREVYEAVNFHQPEAATLDSMVSSQQFAIRVAEHAQTVEALMSVVVRACGYSGSTFGLTQDVAKTATEVNSYDSRSRVTRERKTRYWGSGLTRFFTVLSALDARIFTGTAGVPTVTFPPDSTPNVLDTAQAVSAFRAAQAMSIETGVRLAQPDLDEEGVRAEVARIAEETAAAAPAPVIDPFGLAGADTAEPPPPEDDEGA